MSRIAQPSGGRGSLKWIQHFVNNAPHVLDREILRHVSGARSIIWKSPLVTDDYAEYRDDDFLKVLGLDPLQTELASFWPRRGPQWDALALSDQGDVILVEAKAHIAELHSPPSQAGEASLEKIRFALAEAATEFGAPAGALWHGEFYQLANRLAHLHFLRKHGVPAWLALVNFTGDADMRGPESQTEWEAAYLVASAALGISQEAPLLARVIHIYPEVGI